MSRNLRQRARLYICLPLVGLAACSPEQAPHAPAERGDARGTATRIAAAAPVATDRDRARIEKPEERLAEFLRLSLPTVKPNENMFDSLWTCLPDEAGTEYQWLGDYKVLSARMKADTAVVAAEVLTVAVQEEDPHREHGWIATRRMRRDTLEWNLVRPSPEGEWMVCGLSREGVDLSRSGTRATVTWQPKGTTWDAVVALVDSIQRAKGR